MFFMVVGSSQKANPATDPTLDIKCNIFKLLNCLDDITTILLLYVIIIIYLFRCCRVVGLCRVFIKGYMKK